MATVPVHLVGAAIAAGAAMVRAVQSIALRVGTDRGRATDALLVVLWLQFFVVTPLALARNYPDFGVTTVSLVAFTADGIVETLFGQALYFLSIERIGASRTDSIKAAQPLFAAVVAVVVLGEVLTAANTAGIVLIIAGIAFISWETTRDNPEDLAPREAAIGVLFPLTSAFLFGVGPTLIKIGLAERTPILVALSIKTFAAASGVLLYLWWRGALPSPFGLPLRWYILAGVANTLFTIGYFGALSVAPIVVVIPVLQTIPLFVIALSWLFLRRTERITPRLVAAACVVVAGTVVVTRFGVS